MAGNKVSDRDSLAQVGDYFVDRDGDATLMVGWTVEAPWASDESKAYRVARALVRIQGVTANNMYRYSAHRSIGSYRVYDSTSRHGSSFVKAGKTLDLAIEKALAWAAEMPNRFIATLEAATAAAEASTVEAAWKKQQAAAALATALDKGLRIEGQTEGTYPREFVVTATPEGVSVAIGYRSQGIDLDETVIRAIYQVWQNGKNARASAALLAPREEA
jgi:hypothetical protein